MEAVGFGEWGEEGVISPKNEDVRGDWRRLHNEELYVRYCLPNFIWVVKPKRMRWVRYMARGGKERRL
jgi:hypothetical protein